MMSRVSLFATVQSILVCSSCADTPVISRNELLKRGAVFFAMPGVDTFTSLLYDTAELRHDILVGARNHMFRFDESFDLQEFIELAPTANQTQMCTTNHTEEDCHNFIQVMAHSELVGVNMIFACGTNAFAPVCHVRHGGQIRTKLDTLDGKGWLPSNPCVPAVEYLGERLFLGTALDDMRLNASISAVDLLNQSSTDSFVKTKDSKNWLNNAEFVKAFQYDKFVFFVFREVGIESPDEQIYSRIGRVCEDDKGKSGHWTSFTKARLKCGDFDKVQGATFSPVAKTLYASFMSDAGASAVCTFDYSTIEDAFNGPRQCRNGSWTSCPVPKPQNQEPTVPTCFGARTLPSLDHVLMWNSILPKCGGPLYEDRSHQYSVIDVAEDEPGGPYAFVGDQDGRVYKLGSLECGKTRPLEIWNVTHSNDSSMKNVGSINVLSVYHSVFLLTNDEVMKIPLTDIVPTTTTTEKSTTSDRSSSRAPITTTAPSCQGTSRTSWLLVSMATLWVLEVF